MSCFRASELLLPTEQTCTLCVRDESVPIVCSYLIPSWTCEMSSVSARPLGQRLQCQMFSRRVLVNSPLPRARPRVGAEPLITLEYFAVVALTNTAKLSHCFFDDPRRPCCERTSSSFSLRESSPTPATATLVVGTRRRTETKTDPDGQTETDDVGVFANLRSINAQDLEIAKVFGEGTGRSHSCSTALGYQPENVMYVFGCTVVTEATSIMYFAVQCACAHMYSGMVS